MPELSDLPALKRVQRYFALAEEAQREASRTTGVFRQSYLVIAEQWLNLASETSKQINAHLSSGSEAAE